MYCPKCGNEMIVDQIIDSGYLIIAHCFNCGYKNHSEYRDIISKMRSATKEERESIDENIKKRSIKTGVNFWDLMEELKCKLKD